MSQLPRGPRRRDTVAHMAPSARVFSAIQNINQQVYDIRSLDFIRFRDDPLDVVLAARVRDIVAEDARELDAARQDLSSDGVDTLVAFAERQILTSHRTAESALLQDAFDALALCPNTSHIPWETWVKGGLFVARTLDVDLDELRERFGSLAASRFLERFDVALDAMDRVEELSQCGVFPVSTTPYGEGWVVFDILNTAHRPDFMSVLGFRSSQSVTPATVTEIAPTHSPTLNIAQLAVSLADAIDAAGYGETSVLDHDNLVGSLFDNLTDGPYVAANACLSFVTDITDDGRSFTIYVAEIDPEHDIDALADAAALVEEQVALVHGPVLVLMSAVPSFEDESDEEIDFTPFLSVAEEILGEHVPLSS